MQLIVCRLIECILIFLEIMSQKDMEKIKKTFGNSVREKRNRLGISQEELAERADLHRTYIGDVERGQRNVGLINIVKIARALKTTVADLTRELK